MTTETQWEKWVRQLGWVVSELMLFRAGRWLLAHGCPTFGGWALTASAQVSYVCKVGNWVRYT